MRAADDYSASRHQRVIELRVGELRKLFNANDPLPFRQRDLHPDVENFIVGWARDAPRSARLEVLVYVDRPVALQDTLEVRDAVCAFFSQRANDSRQGLRHLLRIGRTRLIIGISFFVASVGLASAAAIMLRTQPLAGILRESLLIGGWIAMWRPLDTFLYAWWPIRSEAALFDRLSAMPVRVLNAQSRDSKPSVGPVTLR